MAARKKATGWGGWRPGAGPKRVLRGATGVAFDLESSQLEALDALARMRRTTRAALLREAVRRLLVAARRRGT